MENQALSLLRTALNNPSTQFRPGQWMSIASLLQRKKILVVQRTGWGKSMVYFLATRLLRDKGAGVTLLISPLLSLMRNQIQAAGRIGISARTINSTNVEKWEEIENDLKQNNIDILLISPERLGNDKFRQNVLNRIADRVGLFVVDEAHCISDWGHDFRPDYRRIVRILRALPSNIPVLATTATANNRVVKDVALQLGNMQTIRGSLIRQSLRLQNITLPNPAERLAWLAEVLPQIDGSGIIYTLTKRDAERVTSWLKKMGLNVLAYHSESENREELEDKLLRNEVKALVATVALGMGFDKPDLSFVIHYQRPGSVVHYYQQVGRAGRAVESAYGVLLSGDEDREITDYFIRTAFPPQAHIKEVLAALEQADDGLSVPMMQGVMNLNYGKIEKVLKLLSLEDPSPVMKEKSRWYRTPVKYEFDEESINRISTQREIEQQEMLEYMHTEGCLMEFLSKSLDDPHAGKCGKCSNCIGKPLLPEKASLALVNRASVFIRRSHHIFEPRRMWPSGFVFKQFGWKGKIKTDMVAENGRALSLWGDVGWGEMVRKGKFRENHFDDELIDGCLEMIRGWQPDPKPQWLTCIPSLNHPELVSDFAHRLARKLGIPFIPCIIKISDNEQQKMMQNSFQQVKNLDGVFAINGKVLETPVFLIDDMVDSKWTMTVAAALLRSHGSGEVYPLALAMNSLN